MGGKYWDVESLYDYFGARYYDSRIGRWLAPDPFAEKYPSLTPFQYSGNNPILFVDFDGRNFGVQVDNDKKTVTVTSTYYVQHGDKYALDAMQAGVSQWNSQTTTMSLAGAEYTVSFDFNVEQTTDLKGETDNDYEANSAQSLPDVAWNSLAEKHDVDPQKTGGMCFTVSATGSRQQIFLRGGADNPAGIAAHEIGESLFLEDRPAGENSVMSEPLGNFQNIKPVSPLDAKAVSDIARKAILDDRKTQPTRGVVVKELNRP